MPAVWTNTEKIVSAEPRPPGKSNVPSCKPASRGFTADATRKLSSLLTPNRIRPAGKTRELINSAAVFSYDALSPGISGIGSAGRSGSRVALEIAVFFSVAPPARCQLVYVFFGEIG